MAFFGALPIQLGIEVIPLGVAGPYSQECISSTWTRKWLITMVKKSPKDRVANPFQMAVHSMACKWVVVGKFKHLSNRILVLLLEAFTCLAPLLSHFSYE